MIKNSFFSVTPQEENKGSVEFQVLTLPIKYGDSPRIWNCTKKIFYLKEVCKKFWENINGHWLICQRVM